MCNMSPSHSWDIGTGLEPRPSEQSLGPPLPPNPHPRGSRLADQPCKSHPCSCFLWFLLPPAGELVHAGLLTRVCVLEAPKIPCRKPTVHKMNGEAPVPRARLQHAVKPALR